MTIKEKTPRNEETELELCQSTFISNNPVLKIGDLSECAAT